MSMGYQEMYGFHPMQQQLLNEQQHYAEHPGRMVVVRDGVLCWSDEAPSDGNKSLLLLLETDE
jgi:hypothetical protein